jgi:hypothetical protein
MNRDAQRRPGSFQATSRHPVDFSNAARFGAPTLRRS